MDRHHWICETCGVQFPESGEPPACCPICEDDRQYVKPGGQAWITQATLRDTRRNVITEVEPDLWSIRTDPAFGIGQTAFLIRTAGGNLLWDCVTLLDDDTVRRIGELGGIQAIAVSHPHYYSAMAEWSARFGDAPVWIHLADEAWIMRRPRSLRLWSGDRQALFDGVQLVRSGGHFEGYQVAHWPAGAGGKGVLLAGDQPQVCLDARWVTFMYSYPNWIPFDARTVRQITRSIADLPFDRLYGAFGRHVPGDAKGVIARSEARYLRAIGE